MAAPKKPAEVRSHALHPSGKGLTSWSVKDLPPDTVVTKSGKTAGEVLEERRENSRRATAASAAKRAATAARAKERQFRDMIKDAIDAKGGKAWLLSLDDKQFASLALRVVEKDIETDDRKMSHEEWLDILDGPTG
jgi:hypothetical protein